MRGRLPVPTKTYPLYHTTAWLVRAEESAKLLQGTWWKFSRTSPPGFLVFCFLWVWLSIYFYPENRSSSPVQTFLRRGWNGAIIGLTSIVSSGSVSR